MKYRLYQKFINVPTIAYSNYVNTYDDLIGVYEYIKSIGTPVCMEQSQKDDIYKIAVVYGSYPASTTVIFTAYPFDDAPMVDEDSLDSLIEKVVAIDAEDALTVPEEECCEFLKEICKSRRGRENEKDLCSEAIDVLTSVSVFLYGKGFTKKEIEANMAYKLRRTVNRNVTTGER